MGMHLDDLPHLCLSCNRKLSEGDKVVSMLDLSEVAIKDFLEAKTSCKFERNSKYPHLLCRPCKRSVKSSLECLLEIEQTFTLCTDVIKKHDKPEPTEEPTKSSKTDMLRQIRIRPASSSPPMERPPKSQRVSEEESTNKTSSTSTESVEKEKYITPDERVQAIEMLLAQDDAPCAVGVPTGSASAPVDAEDVVHPSSMDLHDEDSNCSEASTEVAPDNTYQDEVLSAADVAFDEDEQMTGDKVVTNLCIEAILKNPPRVHLPKLSETVVAEATKTAAKPETEKNSESVPEKSPDFDPSEHSTTTMKITGEKPKPLSRKRKEFHDAASNEQEEGHAVTKTSCSVCIKPMPKSLRAKHVCQTAEPPRKQKRVSDELPVSNAASTCVSEMTVASTSVAPALLLTEPPIQKHISTLKEPLGVVASPDVAKIPDARITPVTNVATPAVTSHAAVNMKTTFNVPSSTDSPSSSSSVSTSNEISKEKGANTLNINVYSNTVKIVLDNEDINIIKVDEAMEVEPTNKDNFVHQDDDVIIIKNIDLIKVEPMEESIQSDEVVLVKNEEDSYCTSCSVYFKKSVQHNCNTKCDRVLDSSPLQPSFQNQENFPIMLDHTYHLVQPNQENNTKIPTTTCSSVQNQETIIKMPDPLQQLNSETLEDINIQIPDDTGSVLQQSNENQEDSTRIPDNTLSSVETQEVKIKTPDNICPLPQVNNENQEDSTRIPDNTLSSVQTQEDHTNNCPLEQMDNKNQEDNIKIPDNTSSPVQTQEVTTNILQQSSNENQEDDSEISIVNEISVIASLPPNSSANNLKNSYEIALNNTPSESTSITSSVRELNITQESNEAVESNNPFFNAGITSYPSVTNLNSNEMIKNTTTLFKSSVPEFNTTQKLTNLNQPTENWLYKSNVFSRLGPKSGLTLNPDISSNSNTIASRSNFLYSSTLHHYFSSERNIIRGIKSGQFFPSTSSSGTSDIAAQSIDQVQSPNTDVDTNLQLLRASVIPSVVNVPSTSHAFHRPNLQLKEPEISSIVEFVFHKPIKDNEVNFQFIRCRLIGKPVNIKILETYNNDNKIVLINVFVKHSNNQLALQSYKKIPKMPKVRKTCQNITANFVLNDRLEFYNDKNVKWSYVWKTKN